MRLQIWSVKEPKGRNSSPRLRESRERYRRHLILLQYYQDRQRTRKHSQKEKAQASKEQKEKLNRLGKRAVIEESSSSSETEIPIKKERKPTKWEKPATPEFAFDLENEAPSSIIDISSNTTGIDEAPKTAQNEEVTNEGKLKEENGPKPSNCPEKPVIPVKATLSWQMEKRGPIRTSERRHIPPKRYGYDLITKEQEGQEIEEK